MQREPGPLRNGNPRGDPNAAPRCGARTRAGCPCRAPAMANGRCRMHGGRSTGPNTPEGLARLTAARTRHGCYGAELRAFVAGCRALRTRGNLLHMLARNPYFGRDPAELRPFIQPVFPKPQPRKRGANRAKTPAP